MYLNKAIIIGNLTRDPELKALPSGINVTTFSLATNRVWKDKNGAKQESVDYHNIVVFGRQAETAAQYLKKGASALADGKKNYRTEVVADRVQFGPKTFGGGSFNKEEGAKDTVPKENKDAGGAIEYPSEEINPDDIPF